MKQLNKRPAIPEKVKLQLWTVSGGRCQFRGCNKPLWHDDLTLNRLNVSNIAHIISWTANGPRGDENDSPKLAKDISNLMLTCLEHNKMIDDKEIVKDFPVGLLKTFKTEHEKRIDILGSITEEMKTKVLILQANIGNSKVRIDYKDVHRAVLPFFPSELNPACLDLTTLDNNTESYMELVFSQIESFVRDFFNNNNIREPFKHVSVFGLAPIPILAKLGYEIGSKIPTRLFQKHRNTDNWLWKSNRDPNFKFKLITPKIAKPTKNVNLLISLSGKITSPEIGTSLENNWDTYEITIETPSVYFLNSESQLEVFTALYRDLISNIKTVHGSGSKIHIYPAVPAPIAIELGRALLPKIDPEIVIYDRNRAKSDFFEKVISLNSFAVKP